MERELGSIPAICIMKMYKFNRKSRRRKFKVLTTHVMIPVIETDNGNQFYGYGEVKYKKGSTVMGRLDETKQYVIVDEQFFPKKNNKDWLLGGFARRSFFVLVANHCKKT